MQKASNEGTFFMLWTYVELVMLEITRDPGRKNVCAIAIHQSFPHIGLKILPTIDSLYGHLHLAIMIS